MKGFDVCSSWAEIAPYVDAARGASDANSHSLGFLRSAIFDRYAKQEKLLIARNHQGDYVGHLLFDYSFPKAVVLQIYCVPEWRGRGVAKTLLNTLKESLQADGFLSIRASVAEDLRESNAFWEASCFYVARRRLGGATTGRMILVRVHELDSPQLFARSGLSLRPSDSLGVGLSGASALPVYLIDLNVVFDVAHKRAHAEDAKWLLHASHSGECRVLISDEMFDELLRTTKDSAVDPMLQMIGAMPRLPVPSEPSLDSLSSEIAKAFFPEKLYPSGLSKNDRSDVRHVATAISCGATAFVTRDQRILDAAPFIEGRFGLKVLLPDQLKALASSQSLQELAEVDAERFVEVCTLREPYDDARALLLRCGVSAVEAALSWLPSPGKPFGTTVVRSAGRAIALLSAAPVDPKSAVRKFRVAVDEDHDSAGVAARLLMQKVCGGVLESCSEIRLDMPDRQVSLREAAFRLGFRSAPTGGSMSKVSLGCAIGPHNWGQVRDRLHKSSGLLLPERAPSWTSAHQLIEVNCPDGERRHVPLIDVETLLSPALLCLAGRPATMVSIRPKYSEALLGGHRQLSLAPTVEAATFTERLFLCSPRLFGQFGRDGLIFFYQSQAKGAQAVIAVARIVDVNLIRQDEMHEESLRRSVLGVDSLGEIGSSSDKTACLFDNLVFLPRPVDLGFLTAELDYHSARLTSVGRLDSARAMRILEKGFPRA